MKFNRLLIALTFLTAVGSPQSIFAHDIELSPTSIIASPPKTPLFRQITLDHWSWAAHSARSLRVSQYEFLQVNNWRYSVSIREDRVFCITHSPSGAIDEFELTERLDSRRAD